MTLSGMRSLPVSLQRTRTEKTTLLPKLTAL
jgi:hypothetical protein